MIEQFLTEWIIDVLVVVEATVQTLHVCGWQRVQKVLLEVGADQSSTSLREAGVVKLHKEWAKPGRNDRIEYHLRTTGRDVGNSLAIVSVIEGEILLSDDRATVGRYSLTDFSCSSCVAKYSLLTAGRISSPPFAASARE